MGKKSSTFSFGVMLVVLGLVCSFFVTSVSVEAKRKTVTTENGTKLYCYSSKGKTYEVEAIENEQEDLVIPETVDGVHKITRFAPGARNNKYKKIRRIYFPSGIEDIYEYESDEDNYMYNAFSEFPNLTSVSFSENNPYYTAKDGKVYDNKKQLVAIAPGISEVNIESWVSRILPNAYSDLTNVERFSVETGNKKYKSIDGALYSKDGTTLIYYPVAKKDAVFRVPQGVKTVKEMACFEQKYVKEIKMSSSVQKIKEYAFAWCTKLQKVSLNKKLKVLEQGAFANNKWLSMSFPSKMDKIEIGTLPVRKLEIREKWKKVMLDVDAHSRETWLKAKTLVVRSRTLNLVKLDEYYMIALDPENYMQLKSVYKNKTISAYEDSKTYKELSKIAEKYHINLKVLK